MGIPATSFRDPDGACRVFGGRVVRRVVAEKGEEFAAFLNSPGGREMLDRGWLVATRRLGAAEVMELGAQPGWSEFCVGGTADHFYEHERIPFASYPHEWPPELLWAAARLTLDVARRALADGWGLKDATPMASGCHSVNLTEEHKVKNVAQASRLQIPARQARGLRYWKSGRRVSTPIPTVSPVRCVRTWRWSWGARKCCCSERAGRGRWRL